MRLSARTQYGFTIVELLVAALIGSAVMATAVTILVGAQRRSDAVQRRTDGQLRARIAMDAVVRELRAQACLTTVSPPAVPIIDATSTSVTFYADFGGGADPPSRRTLTYDPAAETLAERVWTDPAGTGTPRDRRLATNITPVNGTTPVFQYFAYNDASPPTATAALSPAPGTGSGRLTVARIVVSFRAEPAGIRDGTRATTLQDEVATRLADPDGGAVPVCG